ncbi:MAG TPA: MCE family protein [Micromonosporaceae bacterium]
MMIRRAGTAALLAAVTLLGVAGCGLPSLADLPLPGGGGNGPAYHVTVEFADVLDLVPHAAVKVDDVTVGSVEKVWLSGWTARVRLRVNRDVHLPDNAVAAIRQTSLLGEKFVALSAPTGEPAQGTLGDGDVIPLARTRRAAEVEEVLAALATLLNGGGLEQVKTISQELGTALDGRESAARDLLNQLDTFIAGLDKQKADIVRALDAMDRLTARLAEQKQTIGDAVDALAPGLTVLAQQRQQLTAALDALGKLGTVGTRVVTGSRADTVASLKDLQPTLDQLVRTGNDLPKAVDFLLTYPFPANVTGAIHGDYVNLHITLDLDAATILANLLVNPPGQKAPVPGTPAVPTLPSLPPLPLPSLPNPLPSGVLPSLLPSGSPLIPGLPIPGLPLGLDAPATESNALSLLTEGLTS